MSTGGAALIGRDEELARLRAIAKDLSAGGVLALVEGDAGAGKTRLMEELNPAALGAALEYAGAPYAPIRDVLAALDARFPRVLKQHPDLGAGLRPILDLQPGQSQRDVLDAASRAVALYAQAQPLVIAVEDLHWIDSASSAVLAHLARSIAASRVLLIGTYRGSDAAAREESRNLIGQLARAARVSLVLRPLSEEQTQMLIAQVQSDPLPFEVRRTISELAQGNPLLVTELVRHASADPASLHGALPVSLQAIVHERLAAFGKEDRDALRVCAAMESFELATVAGIAGTGEPAMLAVLRRARDAGIVSERDGKFVFAHALIRHAITAELFEFEIKTLHAKIARSLERAPESPERQSRLAYHYWMAGEAEAAEKYNILAARAALDVYAYNDATLLLERAVCGRDLSDDTLMLYEELTLAYEKGGRHDMSVPLRRRIVDFARGVKPPEYTAQAYIALSRARYHAFDDEGSITAIREGIDVAGEGATRTLRFELFGLLAWYLVHLRRLEEARIALDAAEALIDAGTGIPLVRYYEARAAYEVHALGGGEWKTYTERAIELAQAFEPFLSLSRYGNAMALAVASEIDEYDYALSLVERMQPLLDRVEGQTAAPFLHMRVRLLYVTGRLGEARSVLERMLPYLNDGAVYRFRAASVGIPLTLRSGDRKLLEACTRSRVLEEAFASKDPVIIGPVACGVAEYMIAQGRTNEAAALVERTLSRIDDAGNNFDLLLLAVRIGSQEAVRRAAAMIEPWAARSASARAVKAMIEAYRSSGAARRESALLAAALFGELPWPLHRAQALELAGEAMEAQALFAQCGAHAEAVRISQGLARTPAVSALSRRESEVALLVAEGKSNRLIAETLVLSERTIENHIASIFAKLGMRSRSEIASFVAREKAGAV